MRSGVRGLLVVPWRDAVSRVQNSARRRHQGKLHSGRQSTDCEWEWIPKLALGGAGLESRKRDVADAVAARSAPGSISTLT